MQIKFNHQHSDISTISIKQMHVD